MKQMKPFERVSALAVMLVCVSLFADAAEAQSADRASMIERADTNQDGDIAWSEVTAMRSQAFAQLDRNGDGVINTQDSPPRAFAGRFNEALERVQADFDSDRDGEITQDEMFNAPAPMFEAGDTDGNGVLTAQEMAALQSSAASR
ncbi:MAG: hypothetical protein AAFO63_01500 [Pseudomonadota bacterium]